MKRFLTDEGGTAAVEYRALALFIGLSLVIVLDVVGVGLKDAFAAVRGFVLPGTAIVEH